MSKAYKQNERRTGALARAKASQFTEKNGRTFQQWEARKTEMIKNLEAKLR
jgi:hypothetical protein